MHFVIIGGDAAGMSAASRARRHDPDMDITVLEKTGDVSYSACGMPYNVADRDNPMDVLVVRQAHVFREKQNIDLLTGHEATAIDPKARQVAGRTENGQSFTMDYDRLLIATGASPIMPDVPGADAPGVMAIKERLEGQDFEVIAFHCNGIGGQAMEALILEGVVKGVIDFSPHEITDLLFGGLMPAMPGRLQAAGQMSIPQIVTPGATDIRLHGRPEELPAGLRQRASVQHTPTHTHVRTSAEEMAAVARTIAERLNAGGGPRAVMIPLHGYSMLNRQGEVLYDEASNRAFAQAMEEALRPDVEFITVEAHINDLAFAEATVATFLRLRSSVANGQGEAASAAHAQDNGG